MVKNWLYGTSTTWRSSRDGKRNTFSSISTISAAR